MNECGPNCECDSCLDAAMEEQAERRYFDLADPAYQADLMGTYEDYEPSPYNGDYSEC